MMMILIKNWKVKQNIGFLIVGGIGIIINYLVFNSLKNIISFDFAWLSGILISAQSNYYLNSRFVFKGD
jgi:putative flippase GtrA